MLDGGHGRQQRRFDDVTAHGWFVFLLQVVGTAEDDDSDVDSTKDEQARLQRQLMEQKKKESIELHLGTLVHAVVCQNTPEQPCRSALCARIKVVMAVDVMRACAIAALLLPFPNVIVWCALTEPCVW